jgi:DNA-binding NarL/FixJ family response regulator
VHRVVIIDDDRAMRLLARIAAEEAGCQVVGDAATAADGVALVARVRPTLVVMDYKLPDEDGVRVSARIVEKSPEVDVVAWTSSDEPAVAEAFRAAGARHVVPKRELERLKAILRGEGHE